MQQAQMKYDYSTKNFHRYSATNGGVPKEIYVPRADMPQPVTGISVTVAVTAPTPLAEKVKPAKE